MVHTTGNCLLPRVSPFPSINKFLSTLNPAHPPTPTPLCSTLQAVIHFSLMGVSEIQNKTTGDYILQQTAQPSLTHIRPLKKEQIPSQAMVNNSNISYPYVIISLNPIPPSSL